MNTYTSVEAVIESIKPIVRTFTDTQALVNNSHLHDDLGISSIQMVELFLEFDEQLGIDLLESVFHNNNLTIEGIAQVIYDQQLQTV